MTACPNCAAENPAGARFCNQCGTVLDAGAAVARPSYTPRHLAERILKERHSLRGEKKRVTVLFCDIKGSTRLAQQAGAEAWHGILDRFFSLLGAVIHRYEGTINQYTGDGVMALFGAPLALEDHAQRACFAALEIQQELRRFADELRLGQGLNLTLRVGLNSGEVIVGTIGDDLRMDYTAQGHTVNLAARMEHICEPGHVYLTRETARQVEGYFRLRPLGAMEVAGVDTPVEVFDLEGPGALSTRLARSLSRGAAPLIGREAETRQLLAAFEAARSGKGQLVAVIGEAGIGKSRLCDEFTRDCAGSGAEVHRATGVPYAAALPLHPIHTLALSRLGLAGRGSADEIRRLVAGTLLLEHPEHAAALPAVLDFLGAGGTEPSAPELASISRAQLFELLAHYLPCPRPPMGKSGGKSEAVPLVILIEDLHFLDAASEELLQGMARAVRDMPTLLLLNYRPDYDDGWLAPALSARLHLQPLDERQLQSLAAQRLGGDPSVVGLPALITARAGGNPFFVEEAVLSLAEAGYLDGVNGQYRLLKPVTHWPVPDTVHALLAARIDRLPAESKRLLQLAAVIGEPFVATTLATLAERDTASVEHRLDALVEAGFLLPGDGDTFDFRHPLMREVADGQQLESERLQHHARMAALIEAAHPRTQGLSRESVRIAHHWRQAGDFTKAGDWNLLAARWAGTRDMRIVFEQFQLALVHLDRAPDGDEVRRLRIAARAGLIRMAQFTPVAAEQVEQAYGEGRALVAATGDTAAEAELAISYGNHMLHCGDAQGAARLHAEAVRLCVAAGKPEIIVRFRLAILLCHFSAGLPREGIALVDVADGGEWRRTAISDDNFASRGFHALLLAWLGDVPAGRAELAAALAFAEADQRDASWMHAFKVDLAWFAGDAHDVLHDARRAMTRAEASGTAYFRAIAGRAQALALCLTGRAAEAATLLESLAELTGPQGLARQFEANHLAVLSTALNDLGRFAEAQATAERAIASAERSGAQVWEINAWLSLLDTPDVAPARAAQGLDRLSALIECTGAVGYQPFLRRAQQRWDATLVQA